MFCTNCGAQLEEGTKFCTNCGSRVEADAAEVLQPETVPEPEEAGMPEMTEEPEFTAMPEEESEPTAMPEMAEEPEPMIPEENPVIYCTNCGAVIEAGSNFCTNCGHSAEDPEEEYSTADSEKKPGKKIPGGKKVFIAAGAAVAAAAIVACAAPKVGHFLRATFSSPQKYYQYVEKKEAEKLADIISAYYGEYVLGMLDGDNSGEGKIHVEIGEDLKDLAELADVDISWLDKASVSVSGSAKNDVIQGALEFGLNGVDLLSGNVIVDQNEWNVYGQIPELNSKYIGISLDDMGYSSELDEAEEITDIVDTLRENMPSEKEVNDLLVKYAKIAISNINKVKKDKAELHVDEVSQKYRVLKVTMDEDTLNDIFEDILAEIPKDKDLEKTVKKLLTVYEETGLYMSADEIYDAFIEEIEYAAEDLDIDLGGEKITFKVYVDGKGGIRGREISAGDAKLVYAMPQKGSEFGLEMSVEDTYSSVSLVGSGKRSGDKLTGEFNMKADSSKLLAIDVDGFDLGTLKDGFVNGSMTFRLTKSAAQMMDMGIGSNLLTKYGLMVDVESASKKVNTKVAVVDDEDTICALGLELKRGSSQKASVPSSNKVVFVEDMSDALEWLETLETDKLMDKLEDKVKVPSEYLEYIEDMLDMLEYYSMY